MDEQAATAQLTPVAEVTVGVQAAPLQVRSGTCKIFHALYNLCKLKCQGVTNYVAVHSLYFIYKKGLKAGSKKAQTWEIT